MEAVVSKGKVYMVSYDGSDNSDNALNFAIAQMNHKNDQLWILTVCERINASIYTHAYVSADFILDAQHKLEDHAKAKLRKCAKSAHEQGVANVHLLLATSESIGEMVCEAAKQKNVDFLVVGRRGLGTLKRLLLGSVSRYILENATCDVIVVKGHYGPEVEHDTTKAQVKRAEEVERQRRIEEHNAEEEAERKKREFQADLDRNVARLAEEEERRRRVAELEARHHREQEEREAGAPAGEHKIHLLQKKTQ